MATLFLDILLISIMVKHMKASDRHYDKVEMEGVIRRDLLDMPRDIDREILKYMGGRGGEISRERNRNPQGEGTDGRAGVGVTEGGMAVGVAVDVISQVLTSDAL